ncbi:uncharacterized protein LOC120003660 [Tripterygium wilfordii]|uniref:uncharacterized protein LOC120003660 n=1 Tax=Tripterygium wilfordii TaxID=458696 RepID=UPI0018F8494E|nr:uncharacterized protein LOC120003660 [Tripterygium wilfordii]
MEVRLGKYHNKAEASNKIILNGIKKRLESSKGRWVEELPSVLWAYRTTPRRSTGESPFVLAYGAEAVIPLEIGLPTLQTQVFEEGNNDLAMERNLDLLQERRDQAMVRLAAYQQVLSRSYNKNVRARSFEIGDFVLRKVLSQTKDPTDGKLGPNWEGPFQVIAQINPVFSLRGGWKGGKKLLAVGKEARSYFRTVIQPSQQLLHTSQILFITVQPSYHFHL